MLSTNILHMLYRQITYVLYAVEKIHALSLYNLYITINKNIMYYNIINVLS